MTLLTPMPTKTPSFRPWAVALALALLSGCASIEKRTQKLNLGMTKEQATNVLGNDFKTVGARESAGSRKIEVIQYDDADYGELLLYFRDGKLVQWGDIRVLENVPEEYRTRKGPEW